MANVSGRQRIVENPYYVLGLRPGCERLQIERRAQQLLGMLELEVESAARYATPLGTAECTPELVRRALAELREPAKRDEHAVWATLEPLGAKSDDAPEPPGEPGLEGARRMLGWGR